MVEVRPTGLTRNAGWQIGVSRTVAVDPDEAWRRVADPAAWLGAPADDVRSRHELDRIRVGWQGTIVQVTVRPAGDGRTTVRFHQEHLGSAAEREHQREHWQAVLDRLFPN